MEKQNMTPEAREKHLKKFYRGFIRYIMINAAYVLIWMLTGGGYFWPIWPVIVEGLWIAKYAHELGLLNDVSKYKKDLMSAEEKWIEKRVKKDLSEVEEMAESMIRNGAKSGNKKPADKVIMNKTESNKASVNKAVSKKTNISKKK